MSLGIFDGVIFEARELTILDIENMSNISFAEADITRVRFADRAIWGTTNGNKFQVRNEREFRLHLRSKVKWNSILLNRFNRVLFLEILHFIGIYWLTDTMAFKTLVNKC